MRALTVLLGACVLLSGCSTRAMQPRDDLWLWNGPPSEDGATFLGYHGPVESERPILR